MITKQRYIEYLNIAFRYQVYISLKAKASVVKKPLHQVRADLFSDYLRAELRSPKIKADSEDSESSTVITTALLN